MQHPPSRIVLAYVVVAHACLVAAAATAVAFAPAIATSYLAAPALATVHLVTLGWLSATALGALYAVLPLAFGIPVVVRWPDVLGATLVLLGASGVISHMALATYSGVAWSGGTVAAGGVLVAFRIGRALRGHRAPAFLRLGVPLALLLLCVAATFGAVVAVDRERALFAGGHLRTLAAHAHLALVGWLGVLVVAVGHRLLPMWVPAEPLPDRRPLVTIGLLASGALALTFAWTLAPWPSRAPLFAAIPILLGLLAFVRDVAELRRRRKPKGRGLPARDPALATIACSLVALAAAGVLGGLLLGCDLEPRFAALYGVLLLVGGLGGLVLGVGFRLWPLQVWMRTFAKHGSVPEVAPTALASYPVQTLAAYAHVLAVLLLAAGVVTGSVAWFRAGALAWLVVALAASGHLALLVVRSRRRPPHAAEP